MSKLPTHKQLVLLFALNPYCSRTTYREAGQILGISENGVKSRMFRLKQRCPTVYINFKKICKNMIAGGRAINNAKCYGSLENLNIKRKW